MDDRVNKSKSRLQFARPNRRTLFALIACIAVVAIAIVWIREGRVAHLYYRTRIPFYNIYSALRAYDDKHGNLPPAITTPPADEHPTSWRIEVAANFAIFDSPSAEVHATDYDRQKPWDDPSNLRLQDTCCWEFEYKPSNRNRDFYENYDRLGDEARYLTYVKAIVGANTAFDPGAPRSLKQLPNDLVLIVRVEESSTHWMEPEDLRIEDLVPSEQSKHLLLGNNGYSVLFADGEIWVMSSRLPYSDLCKFFTIKGASKFDRDTVLGPYQIAPWL